MEFHDHYPPFADGDGSPAPSLEKATPDLGVCEFSPIHQETPHYFEDQTCINWKPSAPTDIQDVMDKAYLRGFADGQKSIKKGFEAATAGSEDWIREAAEALKKIRDLSREWEANRLGGVNLQVKRWQKLGAIANDALNRSER